MAVRKLFVTDFDGTLTRHDFFHLVVEAFAPADLGVYWQGYRDGRYTHFEALAGIFAGVRATSDEMEALIARTEPDPELARWIERLDAAGWEVVVASAGCAWYIQRVLERSGVSVPVHANPGRFEPGVGLFMSLPHDSEFHCPKIGIDKSAIVAGGVREGRVVAFAGDGVPDLAAARLVAPQRRFARADLAAELDRAGLEYRRFERWSEVAQLLCEETGGE